MKFISTPLLFFFLFLFTGSIYASPPTTINDHKTDSTYYYLELAKFNVIQDIELTLSYLNRAEKFLVENPDTKLEGILDLHYGVAYYIKGNYDKSLAYFINAENIFTKTEDKIYLSRAYNGIGLIQQAVDRHEEAIIYFQKAIDSLPQHSSLIGNYDLNIGISLIELGKYDEAKTYVDNAYELKNKDQHDETLYQVLNRKAELLYLKGNYKESKLTYENILSNSEFLSNWEKSFANAGLAEVYLSLNELELAEYYALKSFNYAKAINSFWDINRNAGILSKVYSKLGKEQDQKYYKNIKKQYEDSLYNRTKISDVNLLQLKQKEKENLILTRQKEKSENKLFIIYILLILLLIKTTLALFFLVKLRKSDKEKTILNKQLLESNEQLIAINNGNHKMFSILSHDLRSPVSSMLQLVELLKENAFSEKEQQEVLGEMHLQLTSTSLMLQNLLKWAGEQMENTKLNLKEVNLVEKVKEVMGVYYVIAKNKKIKVKHEPPLGDDLWVIADEAHLNVILHNIISNAIKYTPENKTVRLHYSKENEICFYVFNEGQPISEKKIKEIEDKSIRLESEKGTSNEYGTGLGLLLVKQYLKPNNATLSIQPIQDKGTQFKLCFKKAN